jgi:hypothetical protein
MIVRAEMFGDASTNNGSVQQHPQVISTRITLELRMVFR